MRAVEEEAGRPSRPMNRREFFARAGMTVAGMTLAGSGWAIDTQGRIIVGSGEHRYEWVPDWLTPPDNIKWGDTHGIAQDSHGRIYITHTVHPDSPSGDAVVVFDTNGKFLNSWGSRFRGGGHGIEVHKEGHQEFLYHCDIAHRIFAKTTLDGEFLWEKGAPEEANVYKEGAPFVPTNIAFAPNGDFYVADGYGSNWIHQYDSKANYIRTFGGPGKEPGKFLTPHGLWLDTRRKEPLLVITDRTNNRMQYFTLDGKFVRVVTEGMRLPCYFDIRGDVLMVADLKSVVTLLDKKDRVITLLGDGDPSDLRGHPRSDFIPGKFIHPHGAKYLHNGDLLVVEWVPIGRVTLLRKIG